MNLPRLLQHCVSTFIKPPSQQRFQISVQRRIISKTILDSNTNYSTTVNRSMDKERVDALHEVFPKYIEEISELASRKPDVLNINIKSIKDYSRTLRFYGDKRLLEHQDIIDLLENYPEIFSFPVKIFEKNLVNMMASCGVYQVPWRTVILENADIVMTNHGLVLKTLENLGQYFNKNEIYSLVYNNPQVFKENWVYTDELIKYLMHTMNISLQRIAKTPGSLMLPMEFYDIRYQYLLRSGNYVHPEANQIGSKPMEAEPAFKHICSTDDRQFIKQCAPQLSLEELNTFKTLHYLESHDNEDQEDMEHFHGDDVDDGYDPEIGGGEAFGKTNRFDTKTKKELKRKKNLKNKSLKV